jgi:enamine deaminase RidA (YjgF/YER057c/UK114 family)
MTVKRHEPSKIYSKVVEANGFVFTAGITAGDPSQDVKGQSVQVLKEIDRLLKLAGTDKT